MRRQVAVYLNRPKRQNIILNQAKEDKDIVFGARSIQQHMGTISRATEDYDMFSSNPKKSAKKVEKKLDNTLGFDYYYIKKGLNKTTWKVKSKGYDLKKGTPDDEGIVDYTTTPKPMPKFIVYNGVRYRSLNEEIKGKKKILRSKEFAYRHEKDRNDLGIINSVLNAGNLRRPKFPNVFK